MSVTSYVVGQWVRGDQFYGRQDLIAEILHGNRNCIWLLGTRRIGKTSVLKQVEYLTWKSSESPYFPLYWDIQSAANPEELSEGFADAVLDTEERLEILNIPVDRVVHPDLFGSLNRLRREIRRAGKKLLLLGDEAEELVEIYKADPGFLSRLRRALQSTEGIRTVLASKIKLWDLSQEDSSTSPFLHGFTPPIYLRGMSRADACALVLQSHLPADVRPVVGDKELNLICQKTNRHPYLLQLLGERMVRFGDLDRAIEDISVDPMVRHLFRVDYDLLTPSEQAILQTINQHSELGERALRKKLGRAGSAIRGDLHRLERLGFLELIDDERFRLANEFFRRWFQTETAHQSIPNRILGTGDWDEETSETYGDMGLIDRRYELLESLGKGASGEVFKARDTLLQTIIAIKILDKNALDEESMERLRREVLLSRDLTHANILKVFHLGEDAGRHYITIQFVEGRDLAELIKSEGALSVDTSLDLARQLSSALAAAHDRKILHRDIKPANILIDHDGVPMLTDFGLARRVGGIGITREGAFIGSPAYASPEQIRGERLDSRSDLYSMGVVFFEMVTGQRPFLADRLSDVLKKHLVENPPAPASVNPSVPAFFSDVILKCLAKNPDERVQTAGELFYGLERPKQRRPWLDRFLEKFSVGPR